MRRILSGERGAVLVVTLLVAVVGTVVLGAMGTLAQGSVRAAGGWRDEGAARYVAESGINEALYRLKFEGGQLPLRVYPDDPPSFSSNGGLVGSGARYDVWVWPASGQDKHIVAVGVRGATRQRVRVLTEVLQANPFSGDLGGGGSGGGSYPRVQLPPLQNPPAPLSLSGGTHYIGGNPVPRPSNYIEPLFRTAEGVAVYCWASVTLSGNARLVVLGPVQAWVVGDIKATGNATVNFGGDPTQLVIWVPGETHIDISLLGTNTFVGCIYAPFSSVSVGGNATVEGAVVAANLTVRGSAVLTEIEDIIWPEGTQLDWEVVEYE